MRSLEIFNRLSGRWKLSRRIFSELPKSNYTAEGIATFTQSKDDKNVKVYQEEVLLCDLQTKQKLNATKKYYYKFHPETSQIAKYFEDNRLFYYLELEDDVATGNHLCNLDTYSPKYEFEDKKFTLKYSVNGPNKIYESITVYTKIEESENIIER